MRIDYQIEGGLALIVRLIDYAELWLCRAWLWLRRSTLPVRRDGWPRWSLVARWTGWTGLLEVFVPGYMCVSCML
jgi:hypothetical protein